MPSEDPLARNLAALSNFFVGESTLKETFDRVAHLAQEAQGVGALNLYSRSPAAFSDEDIEVGFRYATQAAIVLANAQAYWDAYQLSQDLATAMRSRAVIEQAKGIMMGAPRCSADEAFQILVRASQRENRKLRDIAEELVSRAEQSKPPKE